MKSYENIQHGLRHCRTRAKGRGLISFSDCESDYDLPGPALHIDETPSPPFYNSTTTVDESCVSSENVGLSLAPSSCLLGSDCLTIE